MKCNSPSKDNCEAIPLTDFWVKHVYIYKTVGSVARRGHREGDAGDASTPTRPKEVLT